MCNGVIAGMVAICAGANVVYPWAAFVIGFIGGLVYKGWSYVVAIVFKIDDPIDAFAVHAGAGAWGVIAVTLFAMDEDKPLVSSDAYIAGIFYSGEDSRKPWVRLGWNILGLLVICSWTAANMFVLFFILRKAKMLRVDDEVIAGAGGLDKAEHGEFAYVLEPTRVPPESDIAVLTKHNSGAVHASTASEELTAVTTSSV